MKFKETINQIKTILGLEVKLTQETLVDGTFVEAEVYEAGYPLFIVVESELSPAPEGDYELENGTKLTVDANGIISAVEVPGEEEAPAEEAPAEEAPVDAALMEEKFSKAFGEILLAMETLSTEISTVKAELASVKEQYTKLAAEPAGVTVPAVTKNREEDFSKLDARLALIKSLKEDIK